MTKRKELKERNPELKNTEISSILGELWRKTADEEKRPFVQQEEIEREKYKEKMSVWREKKAKEDLMKKEREAENTAKAIAEKKMKAELVSSKGPYPPEDFNSKIDHQPKRMDSFPPPRQQQYHPYLDHYDYGQGWQNQDMTSQYHTMPPNHQHHQGEFHLPPPPPPSTNTGNGHEKYNESFDMFQNQHQFVFSDHSQYYEQGQHRHLKLEEAGTESPYSYSEEFDPVPLH